MRKGKIWSNTFSANSVDALVRGTGFGKPRFWAIWPLLLVLVTGPGRAAETNRPAKPSSGTNAAPKTAAVQAAKVVPSLPGFIVKPGFRVELVATSPVVVAPSALAFDEDRRLYVTEMRDYPDERSASPHLGRVRLLEPGAKGEYSDSTIFAEDLPWPSAIACYAGGVFVGVTPDILYLKDTNGDGVADVRTLVFSGFGGTNRPSPHALLSSFAWGPDFRIHGLASGIKGPVTSVESSPPQTVELFDNDFSFDPFSQTLRLESGPSSSGLSFDVIGRKFVSDTWHPIRMVMIEDRYARRNPLLPAVPEMTDVLSMATTVFRYATNRPSRPSSGGVTNLLSPSWLSKPRSVCVYQGGLFPTNYAGNYFLADPENQLVHRVVPRQSGWQIIGTRAPEERNLEFLVSVERNFRPAHLTVGPEGALYIADLREGRNSGRILRVVPETFAEAKPLTPGEARANELPGLLVHTNQWQRETAGRLLLERRDPAVVPLLSNILQSARLPLARLAALRVLDAGGGLTPQLVLRSLGDPDETVRAQAIIAVEDFIQNGTLPNEMSAVLSRMAGDNSARVRQQLAQTAGQLAPQGRARVLADLVRRDAADPWMHFAVLSSSTDVAGELFSFLVTDRQFRNNPLGRETLRSLAVSMGTGGRLDEVQPALEFLGRTRIEPQLQYELVADIAMGLERIESSLEMVDIEYRLLPLYEEALVASDNGTAPLPVRVAATRLLGYSALTYADVGDMLLLMLGSGLPQPLQSAALEALLNMRDPRLVPSLLGRWRAFGPTLRDEAIAGLIQRHETLPAVLAALNSGAIRPVDFSPASVAYLRSFPDPVIARAAATAFGPIARARPQVVDKYSPALKAAGVAERGRQLFLARCAACHQLNGEGQRVGPDLVTARPLGKQALLSAILQPNESLRPGFQAHAMATRDGRTLLGVVEEQTPYTVKLRRPGERTGVWPRANITALQPLEVSLMPEDLELGLSPQDMANLLTYILAAPR